MAPRGGDSSDWGTIMDQQAQLDEVHEPCPWDREGEFQVVHRAKCHREGSTPRQPGGGGQAGGQTRAPSGGPTGGPLQNQSGGQPRGQSLNPFTLQSKAERERTCDIMISTAEGLGYPQSQWIFSNLRVAISMRRASDEEVAKLNNALLVVINEYHLSMTVHAAEVLSPVIPQSIRWYLHPLRYYFGTGPNGIKSLDLHLRERANTLRLGVWLHRVRIRHDISTLAEESLEPQHHHLGELLKFFLAVGNCPISYEDMVEQVVRENLEEMEKEKEDTQRALRAA